MNRNPFRLSLFSIVCVALGLAGAHRAVGFPPVPSHTVFGLIRDQFGVPLTDTSAQVFFQTAAGTNLATTVQPALASGVNYQFSVPLDAGLTADAYQPTAQLPAAPFRVQVKLGTQVYVPIELAGNFAQLGQPAGSTRMDLTLGLDSDGDGLPDAWELAMIAAGHLNISLKEFKPDTRISGNSMTVREAYLAGTYPWNPTDGFRLNIVGFQEALPIVEFMALRGHTYIIRASEDLTTWKQVRFQPSGVTGAIPQFLFETNQLSRIRVAILDPETSGVRRFYRLQVD